MKNSFRELLGLYFESAEFNNLADSSKKFYSLFLTKFDGIEEEGKIFVLNEQTQDSSISAESSINKPETIRLWQIAISHIGSPKSQGVARSLLLVVFSWAKRYGLISDNFFVNLPKLVVNRPNTKPFNKEDIEKLCDLVEMESFPDYFKPYLQCAKFCFETGMRPGEAQRLCWEDISKDYVAVRSAKRRQVGEVSRLCKITEGVKEVLDSLNKASISKERSLVFLSKEGKPLNKDTRSKAISEACRCLGIEHRDFYSTRRGTATEMFKAGYDISDIGAQLGHRSLNTTKIYIRPTLEESANKFRGF